MQKNLRTSKLVALDRFRLTSLFVTLVYVYGQQFPKLLVYKLVNKILETVVHTQEQTTCLRDWEITYKLQPFP